MAKILISGGSGLVGRAVTRRLLQSGHEVAWLSRRGGTKGQVRIHRWDPEHDYVDPAAFRGVDHLIHLAGASIIGRRWTKSYKKKIVDSRVSSAHLIYRQMVLSGTRLQSFTGASAVGYYGANISEKRHTESDRAAQDFLSRVCVAWEKSYEPFRSSGIRTCIVRTAIVLSREGGALRKMLLPFRAGLGAAVGSGRQAFPWIHIDDLASAYCKTIEDARLSGVYNAAAPEKVNNAQFSKALAGAMGKRLWLPNVPSAILKLSFGEAAETLTKGVQVDEQKLVSTGFRFTWPSLGEALANLLRVSR